MESGGELAWFRGEVLRSIVRPRSFARSLASEHFGLAGVLVVVGAGIALSLTIDALVLATKGISPASFVARLIFESLLLGARRAAERLHARSVLQRGCVRVIAALDRTARRTYRGLCAESRRVRRHRRSAGRAASAR